MAGHSPSKTGVNALMFPAIHVLSDCSKKDVDARDERGHDAERAYANRVVIR
jgi:hypothetical protein